MYIIHSISNSTAIYLNNSVLESQLLFNLMLLCDKNSYSTFTFNENNQFQLQHMLQLMKISLITISISFFRSSNSFFFFFVFLLQLLSVHGSSIPPLSVAIVKVALFLPTLLSFDWVRGLVSQFSSSLQTFSCPSRIVPSALAPVS